MSGMLPSDRKFLLVPELRVGLTERECRDWISTLRSHQTGPADVRRVADLIERAVIAAIKAGITNGAPSE